MPNNVRMGNNVVVIEIEKTTDTSAFVYLKAITLNKRNQVTKHYRHCVYVKF